MSGDFQQRLKVEFLREELTIPGMPEVALRVVRRLADLSATGPEVARLAATDPTLAGLLLHTLRRVPAVGETLDLAGWRFEVLDLDGLRIDKVLATPVAPVAPADNTSQA
jgi:CBS domain containing-hemolysin-like protein